VSAPGVCGVLTKSLEGDVVQIVSGGVTDVGRVRTNNEDSFRIVEPLNLFILSDGMGGEWRNRECDGGGNGGEVLQPAGRVI
jgi:serine/threonine protein phosphatase PrpC